MCVCTSVCEGREGAGFHTEGGGGWNFPRPEILKLSMVVTEHKYVSSKCLEILSQIVSEAI